MSFLFPRIIACTRPVVLAGVGAQPYQNLNKATETIIFTGVAASIQQCKETRQPPADLPGDTARGSLWYIFFNQPNGTVKDRDVLTDDLFIRYQILAAYWNSLGYRTLCERLQT